MSTAVGHGRGRVLALSALPAALAVVVGLDLIGRGPHRRPVEPHRYVPGGDPARGRQAIIAYGCGGCHVIPGVRRARGLAGPPLTDLDRRIYVAGVLPNTPENLVHWIRFPQQVDPRSAMPNLGLAEAEARDIAAYLYAPR